MAGAPQGTFAVIPEISYSDISYVIKNRLNRQLFFWIIKENEVHVRRVTREAYHSEAFFCDARKLYEYRHSALDLENDKRHLDEEHEEHLKGGRSYEIPLQVVGENTDRQRGICFLRRF